jgi:hypothetical protein
VASLNKPERGKWPLIAFAAVGIFAVGVVVAWFSLSGDSQKATLPAAGGEPRTSSRMGPGLWTGDAASPNDPASLALQPPQAPHTDADGRLAVDDTLHQVYDFFILGGLPGDRASHVALLRRYLHRTLPRAAGIEAEQIVDRYVLYMNLHDDLLARQALPQWIDLPTPAEAERIINWVVQRTRLRQTILGADVAKAWFADEEAAIQAGIAEFDSRGTVAPAQADAASAQAGEAPNGRVARMQEAGREARREQFLRALAEQASRTYIAVERERQLDAERKRRASP